MLLFKKPFWAGITSGAVRLTFRRWQKPHVRPGGRYRCHPIGVIEVDAVALVKVRDITDDDATRAGFATREALVAYLAELGPLEGETVVYRVEMHHGGDGDRVAAALDEKLSAADVKDIAEKLARMDREEAWTKKTLALIDKHPRVAASELAKKLRRDKLELKADIRKLKKLGLTQSFKVGYEIAPRGRAFLAATRRASKR